MSDPASTLSAQQAAQQALWQLYDLRAVLARASANLASNLPGGAAPAQTDAYQLATTLALSSPASAPVTAPSVTIGGSGSGGGGGGVSSIVAPTLTILGAIPTGAPTGTVVGSIQTNYGAAVGQVLTAGGFAVTASSGSLTINRPRDIMLQRSVQISVDAVLAAGAMGAGAPAVTIGPATVSFPVTEALGSAPTLTLTRAGGALTCVEFNAPLTPLDVITASGGVGPYRFSVITDGSPMEVAGLTASTCQLYMTGWQDTTVATSQTARVRAQDSTGAYGYLDVSCSITAFNLSSISGLILFDPANATTAAGSVTGLTASQGATNFAMVVPTGNTAPTVSTVTGPDGSTRPTIVHTATSQAGLAAGPTFSGSSTTLGPLFSQSSIHGPKTTIIAVYEPQIDCTCAVLAAYNHADPGLGGGTTWKANSKQGFMLGMDSSGGRDAIMGTDSAAYYGVATSPKLSAGWQLATAYGDGVSAYLEPDNPEWWGYSNAISPNFANGGSNQYSDPSRLLETGAMTCDSVQIGGGFVPNGQFTWAYMIACPRTLTIHERQQIYAYLARRFPVSFTPPVREVTSTMQQTFGGTPALPSDFSSFLWGDVWSWEFDSYGAGQPIEVLNPNTEFAAYPNERYPGITSVYPQKTAFFDPAKGALQLRLQPNTAAQQAFIAAHGSGFGVDTSRFNWQGTGIRTMLTFGQRYGLVEMMSLEPRGAGIWPCKPWGYSDVGGSFEPDCGESNSQNPGLSTCTLHTNSYGAKGGPFPNQGAAVRCDDLSVNPTIWGYKWWPNGDGTDSLQFLRNREHVGLPITVPTADSVEALAILADITMGGAGRNGTANTTADAPHFLQLMWCRAYAFANIDVIQPPLTLTKPTLSGVRGNGNTITAAPGTFDWAGTSDYRWYTFDWTNGEVELTDSGAHHNSLTLTDATANQPKQLIFEHGNTNSTWTHRIHSRMRLDPAVTPNLSLMNASLTATTSLPASVGTGKHLAWISPAMPGAAVSITASDTSGNFTVSPDGRELLEGANYHSLAPGSSVTVYLTTTPAFGGPVLNQTFTMTVSGGSWIANANYTLSGAGLVATLNSGGADRTVKGNVAISQSGDYTFTVTATTFTAGNTLSVGVCDSGFTADHNLGADAHSIGVLSNGVITYNGFATGANVGAVQPGDTISIRIKGGYFYAQRNSGGWCGATTGANPSTNTGGIAVSFMSGTLAPIVDAYTTGTVVTAAF